MKKRIFSMFLVVAMLVVSLAGCAYKYEKDDMSKYASFDRDAFKAALLALEIDDAAFGYAESGRGVKVDDAIIKTLAGLADKDDKIIDKAIGKYDKVYYCFYVTGKDGDKEFTAYASSMKESAAVELQLGLSTNEGLSAKIAAALAGYNLGEKDGDNVVKAAYSTKSGTVEAGDLVYVTYKKTVGDETVTYTNDRIVAVAPTGEEVGEGENKKKTPTSFEEYLVGCVTSSKANGGEFGGATYSDVTVQWIVKGGNEVLIDDYKPTEKTEINAVDGTKVDISKDTVTELKYHVYPVYYLDVVEYDDAAAYNATYILKEILADTLDAGTPAEGETEAVEGTLPIFTDNGYVNGDKKINAIVKELVDLLGKLDEAEKKYDDAEKAYKDAKAISDKNDSTNEEKQATADAEQAMKTAESEKNTANTNVDNKIKDLLACTKADADTVETAIVKQYWQSRYDELEAGYDSTIRMSIAEAAFDAAVKYITWEKDEDGNVILPKKALKQAYNDIMDAYEYEFYEGSSSSDASGSGTSVPNYTLYEDLNAYLRNTLKLDADAPKSEIKAKINEEAVKAVKDTVTIYIIKAEIEAIFDTDLDVTKDEIKEFEASVQYVLLQYYSGGANVTESHYVPALQLNKIFDYLTEVKTEGDEPDKDDEDKRIKLARPDTLIKYDIKEDTE